MQRKFVEPSKRDRENAERERELCRFIVWEVFGMSGGSVRKLATFHYSAHTLAVQLATVAIAGYVLRGRVRTQPLQWVSHCEHDTRPDTQPDTLPAIVAEQPADTLPPIVPTHVVHWC